MKRELLETIVGVVAVLLVSLPALLLDQNYWLWVFGLFALLTVVELAVRNAIRSIIIERNEAE